VDCRQKKTEEANAPIQITLLNYSNRYRYKNTGRNTHKTQGNIYNDRLNRGKLQARIKHNKVNTGDTDEQDDEPVAD